MTLTRARDYIRLRRFLCQARIKARLTQQEVANKLGKPQSFVAKYEKGKRRIDVVEFIEICNALGLNASLEIARMLQSWPGNGFHVRKHAAARSPRRAVRERRR